MRILSCLFILLLAFLGITFALLNADPVLIRYYFGTGKEPLSFLIIIAFIAGIVLGLLASFIVYLRLKSSNNRLKARLRLVEEEVSNLRTMPVKNEH